MMNKFPNRLARSLLCLIVIYTLLSLIVAASTQQDLTSSDFLLEASGFAAFCLAWTFIAGAIFRYTAKRWFKELVAFPDETRPSAPDRLTQYLALKRRLHGQYESERWWYPEREAFCFDFRHVEIELPRPIHEQVMVWAQARDIWFSQAVEALLLRGLADDHLDRITIRSGWAKWPKAEGGPPWM